MPYRPTGLGAFGFSLNWEKVPGMSRLPIESLLSSRTVVCSSASVSVGTSCTVSAQRSRFATF